MTANESLSAVLERYKVAMGALRHGDPAPRFPFVAALSFLTSIASKSCARSPL